MAGTGENRAERAGTGRRWALSEQRFRVRTVSVAFPVSNDSSRLVPPPNAHSAPIAPARSRRGSHSYPARRRPGISNDINLLQKGLRLRHAAHTSAPHLAAGWSSPVARQAHNLKVTGSNPVPASTFTELITQGPKPFSSGPFCCTPHAKRSIIDNSPSNSRRGLPPASVGGCTSTRSISARAASSEPPRVYRRLQLPNRMEPL